MGTIMFKYVFASRSATIYRKLNNHMAFQSLTNNKLPIITVIISKTHKRYYSINKFSYIKTKASYSYFSKNLFK